MATLLSVIGSVIGIGGALSASICPQHIVPFMRLDGLAVIFLIPIFLLSALGSIYGEGYWAQKDHTVNGRRVRLFYGLVTAGMAGVAIAAHTIVFLIAWEVMALSAFFLIATEDENRSSREASFLYLVVTHTSTLCLFAIFTVWRIVTGSYALDALPAGAVSPTTATLLFLLIVTAFGCKAGLMPLHIWLPSAHAATPSHVSALMSGILIKIGIYGLIRFLSWLPAPPVWWGGLLLTLGAISGVLGVVLALGQHDLKRLLAYHSIENIGIIVMGIGLSLVGRSLDVSSWIVLGMAGALLHVWNHGLFKALLFLSAGSVIHATNTREIDKLGGLAKTMPWTALMFTVGAAAICGLPPLNGFVSELFIYLGLFRSLGIGQPTIWAGAAFAAPALALIGALAVSCFVKALGAIFLGEARSESAKHAHEVGPAMLVPMGILAATCLSIGLAPASVVPLLDHGIAVCIPGFAGGLPTVSALAPLRWISLGGLALIGLLAPFGIALLARIRRGPLTTQGTWDCGYAAPAPTMQYTASSFAQMLGGFFSWVLRPRVVAPAEQDVFPGKTRFHSHIPDVVLDDIMRPAFRIWERIASWFRRFQAGSIHAYLFYIVIFLMVLLLWR